MTGFLGHTFNRELIRTHTGTIVLIWVLFALFTASNIMLTIFLLMGSFTIIDLRLDAGKALLVDALLSMTFFLQHSVMVRRGFKTQLAKYIPAPYHPPLYGLTSSVTLLGVLLLWQKSAIVLVDADGILYWMLRVLFFACLAGFSWGAKSLGGFDVLGVKDLMRHIRNRPAKPQQIMAKGPYRWVRHPLYLFMIVLIWSCPHLTLDRLIFNILWTLWMIIGTYLEDRDLHREFGSHYTKYSSRVPMLVPGRIPK